MNTQTTGSKPLNIVAMGWAFSAALIALFVICMISSFLSLRPIVLSCPREFGLMAFFSACSLAG